MVTDSEIATSKIKLESTNFHRFEENHAASCILTPVFCILNPESYTPSDDVICTFVSLRQKYKCAIVENAGTKKQSSRDCE